METNIHNSTGRTNPKLQELRGAVYRLASQPQCQRRHYYGGQQCGRYIQHATQPRPVRKRWRSGPWSPRMIKMIYKSGLFADPLCRRRPRAGHCAGRRTGTTRWQRFRSVQV